MDAESLETEELLLKAANGDTSAKASLLDLHRPRLMQIARCRLNRNSCHALTHLTSFRKP